tara:strand:- start:35357 stop:36358 length:1002 start_codon:yes stop_codon:yes gene_type:complete
MPKSIVTGAAGFIGSHMVDLLLTQGHEVIAIDNLSRGSLDNLEHANKSDSFKFYKQDICLTNDNSELLKEFENTDYVFHFAGIGDIVPSIDKPSPYIYTNVFGTSVILEAARSSKQLKKFVYAASSSCYGDHPPLPTNEHDDISPQYPYALSKFLGECEVLHWGKVYDLPVNSVRIFNAYGTRSRTNKAYGAVIGVFIKQHLENKPLTIVGDGEQKRDFIYVTDVAKGFLKVALKGSKNNIYNLGANNPQSVNHLASIIGGEKVSLPSRPGEPLCTWSGNKQISELGWRPEISFEDGIKMVLENKDFWKDAPLWDKESIEKETKSWFQYLKKD